MLDQAALRPDGRCALPARAVRRCMDCADSAGELLTLISPHLPVPLTVPACWVPDIPIGQLQNLEIYSAEYIIPLLIPGEVFN